MPFVLTERLNQDCLEKYFGKHRALGRRNDNPDLKHFGYQSNTFENAKISSTSYWEYQRMS